MTLFEFNNQVTRLVAAFGEQMFKKERIDIIWMYASKLSTDQFSRVIENIILNCRYAPTPSEVIAAIRAESRSTTQWKEDEKVDYKVNCDWCRDSSVNYCVDKSSNKVFIFCDCIEGVTAHKFYKSINGKDFIEIWFDGMKSLGYQREKVPLSYFTSREKLRNEKDLHEHTESTLVKFKKDLSTASQYWQKVSNPE